jgi:hypothetical protein
VGVPMLVTAATCAAVFPGESATGLYFPSALIYSAAVVATTFAYACGMGSTAYFFAGMANMSLLTGRLLFELTGVLKRLFAWEGAPWFVWGIVWFTVGMATSAWKAGLAGRLARYIPRGRKESAAPPPN